jgi:hypothetical protein
VDKQCAPGDRRAAEPALDEWLQTVEIEETTRRTYGGYIERVIKVEFAN